MRRDEAVAHIEPHEICWLRHRITFSDTRTHLEARSSGVLALIPCAGAGGLGCKPRYQETIIQTTTKLMVTFEPDERAGGTDAPVERGLFLGVREEPALESTQLRWQVRLSPSDIVQIESSDIYLATLGGALFVTTKTLPAVAQPDEKSGPVGWIKWMGEHGRRSFQIQLAISAVGFDRICHLAEKGRYPDAILTFKEDGPIEHGFSPDGNKKIWTKAGSGVALLAEYTLRYDFSPLRGRAPA